MASQDGFRTAIAFLGSLFTFALFLSPYAIFQSIIENGSVQEYPFSPYPMALLNCMVWVFYGTVRPGSVSVILINSLGVVIEGIFVGIFVWYSTEMVRRNALALLGAVLVAVSLVAGLGFGVAHTPEMVFGIVGVITGICMYASPLAITKTVFRTGSVEYMSLTMSMASLVSSCFWTAYAFMSNPYDLYVAIPNLLGVLCAVAQLVLYVYFRCFNNNNAEAGN